MFLSLNSRQQIELPKGFHDKKKLKVSQFQHQYVMMLVQFSVYFIKNIRPDNEVVSSLK